MLGVWTAAIAALISSTRMAISACLPAKEEDASASPRKLACSDCATGAKPSLPGTAGIAEATCTLDKMEKQTKSQALLRKNRPEQDNILIKGGLIKPDQKILSPTCHYTLPRQAFQIGIGDPKGA